jgi:hypothetical protein
MAGPEANAKEYIYQAKLVTIHYSDQSQLDEFAKRIQPGAVTRALNRIFLGRSGSGNKENMGEFVDGLFKRVQLILDMPQPKLKIHIQLYRNQKELSDMYASITGRATTAPAFYSRKVNTIYVQTEKLNSRILAHEMGHAIIDHYFVISPPPKIAEMLCQYVDKELSAGNL